MGFYNDLAVVILAAGKGTRMKSDMAKVLHKVAGKSMIEHVVNIAKQITNDNVHVVVGHQANLVQDEINKKFNVKYAVQKELLGTGDAVKAAIPGISSTAQYVLVLFGDVPLIQKNTLIDLIETHKNSHAKVTILATDVNDPKGYGRIIMDASGNMKCIKEEADASDEEKRVKKINTGIFCFDKNLLKNALNELKPNNKQAEYYLTDVVEIARRKDEKIIVVTMDDPRQVVGVNTLAGLEIAEDLISQVAK